MKKFEQQMNMNNIVILLCTFPSLVRREPQKIGRQFVAGICLFHLPLLMTLRLFSFPLSTNMPKFGNYPCLFSGPG